jgi:hypothetical protein
MATRPPEEVVAGMMRDLLSGIAALVNAPDPALVTLAVKLLKNLLSHELVPPTPPGVLARVNTHLARVDTLDATQRAIKGCVGDTSFAYLSCAPPVGVASLTCTVGRLLVWTRTLSPPCAGVGPHASGARRQHRHHVGGCRARHGPPGRLPAHLRQDRKRLQQFSLYANPRGPTLKSACERNQIKVVIEPPSSVCCCC